VRDLVEVVMEVYGLDANQSVQIDVSEHVGGDVLGDATLDVLGVEHKIYRVCFK
jgi:hypothetical protein